MQNAHQQHFSLFNWETHATAHKSSSTRTSAVVCEPGETAHKSSSTHTSAVVCEPCETTHKTSPNLPFAMVVWEPRASAHNTCWPGYLSSVRRDSACSGRLLLVTAFENIVPANIEQTCSYRRRSLKSTLQPTIFWEMVKFVDLGVLYFSLVLPV